MRREVTACGMALFLLAGCAGVAATPPSTPGVASAATVTPDAASPPPSVAAASHAPRRYDIGIPAFGPDGTLYSTDCASGVVLELTSPTTAKIVAGGGTQGDPPFGDGGPATDARLVCAAGLAFDAQGRLLVADHGHNRIRRVEPDGTIVTIVGAASPPFLNGGAFAGDGGPANDASLNAPVGITVDGSGNLYIADRENDRVRKVSADGTITTLAGNGQGTFDGDGKPATEASLDYPLQAIVDTVGNVYISDDNHNRVRRVTPDGTISTVIGDGTFGSAGDGGPAAKAQVNDPQGLALDAAGNLYVSEYGGNRIRRIDPDGVVTTFAGTGGAELETLGGPATETQIPQPGLMTIGPDGALYVNDQAHGRILRIDLASGLVTLAAGGPDGVTVP